MPTRSAKADWHGNVQTGKGQIHLSFGSQPYSFTTRMTDEDQTSATTNPEELIGAAQAACYSMSLAARLSSQNLPFEHIDTECKVTISPSGVGFKISRLIINTKAKVPGMSDEAFQKHATIAKDNCPVSSALAAVHITLNASLTE